MLKSWPASWMTYGVRSAWVVVLALLTFSPNSTSTTSPALFSSHETLQLKLRAPLNVLSAHADNEDGNEKTVRGTLTYTQGGTTVTIDNVTVAVRGHTSRREGECTFPKLKLQLPATPEVERSPF